MRGTVNLTVQEKIPTSESWYDSKACEICIEGDKVLLDKLLSEIIRRAKCDEKMRIAR